MSNKARSAILAASIIPFISFGHSKNCTLLLLPASNKKHIIQILASSQQSGIVSTCVDFDVQDVKGSLT